MRNNVCHTSWRLSRRISDSFRLLDFRKQTLLYEAKQSFSCLKSDDKIRALPWRNNRLLACNSTHNDGIRDVQSLVQGFQSVPGHLLFPRNAVHHLPEALPFIYAKGFSTATGSDSVEPDISISAISQGPLVAYKQLVAQGTLLAGDPAQEAAAVRLQKLHDELAASEASRSSWRRHLEPLQRLAGWQQYSAESLRGVYLFGGVGTGKTLMMNVFYEGAPTMKKLRVHFHAFMLDMHSRLHNLDHSYAVKLRRKDPIAMVAEQLSQEYRLLCIDEIEVTDIADALILLRLFSVLWPRGLVLVATSNSAPEELYRNGLNRHLFEPFFGLLRKYTDVVCLDKGKDYRRGHARLNLFVHPLSEDANSFLDSAFNHLTGSREARPAEVQVMMGRTLKVPMASGQVARFSFQDICGKALGAADYLALAQDYEAVFIDGMPWLGDPARENMARRMVNLIDILYENGRILFCSAEVTLELLFLSDLEETLSSVEKTKSEGDNEMPPGSSRMAVSGVGGSSGRSTTMIGEMEWSATGRGNVSLAELAGHGSFTRAASRRTVSRLLEMQSEAYLLKNKALGRHTVEFLTKDS